MSLSDREGHCSPNIPAGRRRRPPISCSGIPSRGMATIVPERVDTSAILSVTFIEQEE
jgi:hypothetical protein